MSDDRRHDSRDGAEQILSGREPAPPGEGNFMKHDPDRLPAVGKKPESKREIHGLAAEAVRHILNENTKGAREAVQFGEQLPAAAGAKTIG